MGDTLFAGGSVTLAIFVIVVIKVVVAFVALLVKELRDRDGRRRDETLQTLLAIASPEVVKAALASLLSHEDRGIRQWAAERLERITPDP